MALDALHDFDQLIYFGDSLVNADSLLNDRGTFDLSKQAITDLNALGVDLPASVVPVPISPPYAMQFSNGAVYSQVTPALLGIDETNVFNFAFGGAEVLGEQTLLDLGEALIPAGVTLPLPDFLPPSLTQNVNLTGQLELFAEAFAETPLSENSAAFVGFGLNDLGQLQDLDSSPGNEFQNLLAGLSLASQIVGANIGAAEQLAEAGVGTIVINTLPAASFFPASQAVGPEAQVLGDLVVDVVNFGLRIGAAGLAQDGVNVKIVDLHALSDEIADDFGTFGFLEFEQSVLIGNGVQIMPNPAVADIPIEDIPEFDAGQVAFWDSLHFTENLHGIFGAYSARSLTSEVAIRGDANDLIFGARENDLVLSSGGDDTAFLGRGDDVAFGGLDDDRLFMGRGSDLAVGGSGNDELFGGRDADVLAGSAGDDDIYGGSGGDALIDGLGSDELFGNSGDDFFLYTESELIGGEGGDRDVFVGGSGEDTVVLALSAETLAIEQQHVEDNFESGRAFEFESIALSLRGIETVVLTEGLGFEKAPLPTDGDLGERLAEADLFGVI